MTIADDQFQNIARHTCLPHKFGCETSDQGRCFCGLAQHTITCCKGCCNLSGVNGQRKVPRRDTSEDTDSALVFLFTFCCIKAKKVDGLTQFAYTIKQGLSCFTHEECKNFVSVGLIKISHLAQNVRARFWRACLPRSNILAGLFNILHRGKPHLARFHASRRVTDCHPFTRAIVKAPSVFTKFRNRFV